ncbi:MAG TPA: PIN domain-containing protein [Terriglobales bacterium]|nr:PIN domain-containing protein [Terriglobales bacterium]
MIIADTGFWLALANRSDRYHAVATKALAGVAEPLITTWPVMTETCHLLAARLGVEAQLRFLRSARDGAFSIFRVDEHHLARMAVLVEKYRELPMDLADASLVLLAEELGSGKILSTDRRDFGAYRWKRRRPFINLLPE